jgi:hypothetical protein
MQMKLDWVRVALLESLAAFWGRPRRFFVGVVTFNLEPLDD